MHTGSAIKTDTNFMMARTRRTSITAFFEAGKSRMAKIPTARSLQQIPTHSPHQADLGSGQTSRSQRQTGIMLPNGGMPGQRVDLDKGPNAHKATCISLNLIQPGDSIDIDKRTAGNPSAPTRLEIGATGTHFAHGV